MGFIPQDNIIHPHLTVFKNILHSARIRLGGALNDEIIQKHVDAIIDGLGLSTVKYSVISSEQRRIISGGERKRISIALELVAAPQVLILDEPTSGLDAQAALSIIELLRLFSRQGLTVICVIHQPRVEIFKRAG
jgi:ABC-type multidrug transport system ATPase subunit